ncbi:hypothetical protein [Christiangramia salexigens]|uniref:Uncharacterized protein n=1 Tax=Christiangramia salexigens TaxID=1913577 RepID=A0A1L3J7R7_9FLAO|nr:hypothetical protein [Christiangramia salexigens]APG61151.1 hypothetical protein LPB144_12395 [Christiangramia salexigens]
MKNIKIFLVAFLAVLSVGCENEDKIALQVQNLETGAFLRTIEVVSGGYDFLNLDTAEFSVIVEESDAQDGEELESMDVYVAYRDGNGDDDVSEVFVKSISASEFTTGENGLPRYNLKVTAQESLSALGVDEADLVPGDQFRFRLAVNLTNGATYTAQNSGGNLSGLFFSSPFRYNVTVGCPLEDDQFTGQYKVTLVEGFDQPFGDFTSAEFTANVSASTSTKRQVDIAWLSNYGFGVTLQFEFVCTEVSVIRNSTGIGCGGSIAFGQGAVAATPFDIDDDSSFTLKFQDFVDDGGCGVSPYNVELKFEKQ